VTLLPLPLLPLLPPLQLQEEEGGGSQEERAEEDSGQGAA
jgi:hypothetical protein